MEPDAASQATATPETEAAPADAGAVRTASPLPAGTPPAGANPAAPQEANAPRSPAGSGAAEASLPSPRAEVPEADPTLFDAFPASGIGPASPLPAGTADTGTAEPVTGETGPVDAADTADPVDAADSGTATASEPPRFARLRAYVRLAKLDILDYYLGLPIVWAMLRPGQRLDPRELAVLGLFLVGEVALVGALVAFDDVTGLRDGSDHANYGGDNPSRPLRRKPLIAGTLRESDAIRFGWLAAACAAAAWAGAVALAPHRPTWTLLAVGLSLVLGFQYSWWLSFSYHGFQELFLVALGWACLLPPHGLVSGTVSGFAVVQTLLFGLGPVLFGVYSNTNDIEGDRAVNRPTMATMTSPRGNAVFIAALSAAEAALIVGSAATGLAPWWFALALAPIIAARVTQFVVGMPLGRVLAARKLGIHIHRALVVALVVVDLCHGGVR